MPRSKKRRNILGPPAVLSFKPQGIPNNMLLEAVITLEEYEAIRLADLEAKKHDDAALEMGVSRPTFTRLLSSAHKKISDAIINGKSIVIDGGDFVIRKHRFICNECRYIWEDNVYDNLDCPECGSHSITHLNERFLKHCEGRRRHRGFGRKGRRRF